MELNQLLVLMFFFGTIGALIFTNQRPSTVFALTVLGLLTTQQITFDQILDNLTNKGLITLILLLLVSSAIDKTAFIKRLGRKLVTASFTKSYWRLFGLTFFSSALLNNTAIVASLIGPVKQNQYHPASRLLIPLSYAAILGGTVTLIGTSTNLIVDSFLQEHGHPGFGFLDFTLFGLVAGLSCGLLMFMLSPLLPDIASKQRDYREYIVEAEVSEDSELVGKTVEQNHLRNLPELFLVEVVRQGKLITPVSPELIIQADDKLIFSGNVKNLDTLSHIKGLKTFAETDGILRENLTEVIVSNRAQIIGQTIKALGFRALFDAAVVAIRRDGEQLSGKLGEIKLQAGDFLLLAAGPDFHSRHNISKNFFILSEQRIARPLSTPQEWITVGGFLLTVFLAATDMVPLGIGLLFFAAVLLGAKVTTNGEIKRNLPLNLIVVIVGALSLATGLEQSGVIDISTELLLPYLADTNWLMALIVVYVLTLLLTEFVTNNAAAALMFPFAYGLVEIIGAPLLPFALAVAFAASASFISPYGYQTNLLVFNAANYKFSHFIRFGLPISIVYSSIVIALLNWVYF
ncbi:SLC13 family permease [Alteromonas oceani]|jgi:di/tricarboxylate transporter|uniref:SLC13 family permease n=1 Tax=Alteromonas oceani TaxID=2071609 RepID=A0ABV7JTK0_9ALTE|nr:SLC13 family permease [Alteromonas oceani]MAD09336.1 SLC13 family permease [Alteromonas sp.]HCA75502.1 SLC13 family permease [Alteromonas sp.]HCB16899.1 SLC13 family permease [Alteromonas sp.]HCL10837.1 SLC13 family permease [Alteromonas sp.]HCV19807.1 SLC13 family permease [Alteromonas sp.]|tara:strand:- start:5404 stop:7128 length:1725 start_codon:yes stop_codon:yes gene_type:complete